MSADKVEIILAKPIYPDAMRALDAAFTVHGLDRAARRLAGAGLDVFAGEPRMSSVPMAPDHVVPLPHVGSSSHHSRSAMGGLVVENLVSWFAR